VLPPELSHAPPRDPAAAGALFDKNRSTIRALAIGAGLAPPMIAGLLALQSGRLDNLAIGLGLGLGAFIGLFAFAMWVQLWRARRFYRDGLATLGTIRRVEAPGDGHGNAYVIVHVEYTDRAGRSWVGQCVTVGKQHEIDRKAGELVAVLYLAGAPSRFAIYTPGLGVTPGAAR